MEPYLDPLGSQLDAVERSIENPLGPEPSLYPNPDELMDPVGRALTALENEIEQAMVPPPIQPDPLALPPQTPAPIPQGYTSPGPPPLPQSREPRWDGGLVPPTAARPYFAGNGMDPRPHRSHGRSGTGIRSSSDNSPRRWCAQGEVFVDESFCLNCSQWEDHGDGVDCYHDWLERHGENDNDEEARECEG